MKWNDRAGRGGGHFFKRHGFSRLRCQTSRGFGHLTSPRPEGARLLKIIDRGAAGPRLIGKAQKVLHFRRVG
jgi:hypothetical protein